MRLQEKTLEEAEPHRAWRTLRRAPLFSDGLEDRADMWRQE